MILNTRRQRFGSLMSYVTTYKCSSFIASPGCEARKFGNLTQQVARKESCLELEQSSIANTIAEQRMRNLVAHAPLEGRDEASSAVIRERNASRHTEEVRRANLAVIDRLNDTRVRDQG